MKPREVVLDLCGDYIRYHGSAIGLWAITESLRAFDVSGESVRVVMSRLRRDGFGDTTRDGRTTTYVITDHTVVARSRAKPGRCAAVATVRSLSGTW